MMTGKKYSLIAFDLDWTLLNAEKKISDGNKNAIRRAAAAGKTVVFSTGRGLSRLRQYFSELPEVRYAVCNNGCVVYDALENRKLYHETMEPDTVLRILQAAEGMITRSLIVSDELIETAEYLKAPYPIEKLNLYFESDEERSKARPYLEALGNIEVAPSDTISLECTKKGITKGTGLVKLCGILGIRPEQTIACGDSGNDAGVMEAAGFAVAVANADPEILKMADAVVADCEHDGCAEAIDKYLLN